VRRMIVPLVGLATLLWLAQPALATFPGHPGRIAFFDLFGRGGSEIYSIAPDGSHRRQLTPDKRTTSVDPAWSPDGSTIAYAGHWNGCSQCIFAMNADGTGRRVLFDPPDLRRFTTVEHPTWSPDGTEIAFCASTPRYGSSRIWVVNADGSLATLKDLSGKSHDQDCEPEWSPDGSVIAFDDFNTFTVDTIHPDGSGRTELIRNIHSRNPSWAPDASHLLFEGRRGRRTNIYSIASDGTDLRQLTNTPKRWEWQAIYSPNGHRIVFNRSQSPELSSPDDLWKMRLDGQGQHPITRTADVDEWAPNWQPT
jgi:Tol biopolymer transport system component